MSTHKHIDKICCVVLALTLVLAATFVFTGAFGAEAKEVSLGYENRLFDTSKVHTVDIVMNDWDRFIESCTDEEYVSCSVVIDGEAYKNVAIRAKGNTSLSNVQSMNSDRYSFKIEFDHYDNTNTYYGLDKLCLNNIIQDNTYMKDYLTYQMMNEFGVAAPLCSYVNITVNGEDWGLYLAVEAIEESFLLRNYGSNYGELYKPDSISMGGGRGNGKDFDMGNFEDIFGAGGTMPQNPSQNGNGDMTFPERTMPDMNGGTFPDFGDGTMPEMPDGTTIPDVPDGGMQMPGMGGNMGGGMNSTDVKLQYIDDNASSYSNIFNNAKTDITEADQNRLIASLKQLSEYNNVEDVVNIDQVLRYFVVHNYVVNDDSYTGSMIHNYYLYEQAGQLSMIPWDYNLAFGTFQGSKASSSVNDSISEVLSDRPMQAWIFSDEEYSAQYYALYAELLESIDAQAIIDNAYSLIASYVEKDPTAFCTYEEFEKGVEAIKIFCTLRNESVLLQLSGSNEQVDTGTLNLSDMGTMNSGMGGGNMPGGNGGNMPTMPESTMPEMPKGQTPSTNSETNGIAGTSFMFLNIESEESSGGSDNSQGQTPPDMNGGMQQGGFGQNGMQFPSNMQGGNGGTSQGGSIGSANTGISVSNDMIMLIVSAVVLAGGLTFAVLFKRRK